MGQKICEIVYGIPREILHGVFHVLFRGVSMEFSCFGPHEITAENVVFHGNSMKYSTWIPWSLHGNFICFCPHEIPGPLFCRIAEATKNPPFEVAATSREGCYKSGGGWSQNVRAACTVT